MDNATKMGINRTGFQMTGELGEEALAYAKSTCSNAPPEQGNYAAMHRIALEEADKVGSVPVPGTMKGMAKTGIAKLTGDNPEVLIDKLGERLAFERTGTRLYEALILKCRAAQEGAAEGGPLGTVDVAELERIRAEEEAHFHLVSHAMVELGADPTAMTPCADVVGVMSQGLLKTITDPRTTVPQSLQAILTAELSDTAGWELLIELAAELGHDDMAARFGEALRAEQQHVAIVQQWMRAAVMAEAS
jgi:rubrerythrin